MSIKIPYNYFNTLQLSKDCYSFPLDVFILKILKIKSIQLIYFPIGMELFPLILHIVIIISFIIEFQKLYNSYKERKFFTIDALNFIQKSCWIRILKHYYCSTTCFQVVMLSQVTSRMSSITGLSVLSVTLPNYSSH